MVKCISLDFFLLLNAPITVSPFLLLLVVVSIKNKNILYPLNWWWYVPLNLLTFLGRTPLKSMMAKSHQRLDLLLVLKRLLHIGNLFSLYLFVWLRGFFCHSLVYVLNYFQIQTYDDQSFDIITVLNSLSMSTYDSHHSSYHALAMVWTSNQNTVYILAWFRNALLNLSYLLSW